QADTQTGVAPEDQAPAQADTQTGVAPEDQAPAQAGDTAATIENFCQGAADAANVAEKSKFMEWCKAEGSHRESSSAEAAPETGLANSSAEASPETGIREGPNPGWGGDHMQGIPRGGPNPVMGEGHQEIPRGGANPGMGERHLQGIPRGADADHLQR